MGTLGPLLNPKCLSIGHLVHFKTFTALYSESGPL